VLEYTRITIKMQAVVSCCCSFPPILVEVEGWEQYRFNSTISATSSHFLEPVETMPHRFRHCGGASGNGTSCSQEDPPEPLQPHLHSLNLAQDRSQVQVFILYRGTKRKRYDSKISSYDDPPESCMLCHPYTKLASSNTKELF